MNLSNINIRTDKELKEQANILFSELVLSMTTAINIFLKTAIREGGLPFNVKLNPNKETLDSFKESDEIAKDKNRTRYKSIQELKKALEI